MELHGPTSSFPQDFLDLQRLACQRAERSTARQARDSEGMAAVMRTHCAKPRPSSTGKQPSLRHKASRPFLRPDIIPGKAVEFATWQSLLSR
jgi:hypothetical protein